MELVIILLVAGVVCSALRRTAAFILGVMAWIGLILMVLSVMVGVPVPASVLVITVALWFASQYASRLRRGEWRSPVLRLIAR